MLEPTSGILRYSMRLVVLSLLLLLLAILPKIASAQTGDGQRTEPEAYRIQNGDKLSVKFFTNPDLNEQSITVRPDGRITLQIINDVKAEGLTVVELRSALEKAYDEVLLQPIITVSVIEFLAPHIFISGQIVKPGKYDLREAKTLMQAVFLAGGFTRDGNKKMVIHARPDGRGEWRIQAANVMGILNQKGTQKDIELRSGDYIYVPESRIAKFSRAVDIVRPFLPRF